VNWMTYKNRMNYLSFLDVNQQMKIGHRFYGLNGLSRMF
jgi:hypothetical protein